tara:strand:+ start:13003 stop:13929 length:927 start_codon:yes stop_codon:yes gene_type:complete
MKNIIIIAPLEEEKKWTKSFKKLEPNWKLQSLNNVSNYDIIDTALVWSHPIGIFKKFKNLKLICSLGAGVDHLISDPNLPDNTKITRIVDPLLSFSMSNYIALAVLQYHRKMDKYAQEQKNKIWDHDSPTEIEVSIGILGLGELGSDAANKLNYLGFKVAGYSRTPKKLKGIKCYSEGELDDFLKRINVLICSVPLTKETEGLLSSKLFKKLKRPTYLINVARGKVQIENDIVEAIDSGILTGAFLDVFENEPLPKSSPLWNNKKIKITPHIASITNTEAGAKQIIENYNRNKKGQPLLNEVDLKKGY